jgi:hypothetical protein
MTKHEFNGFYTRFCDTYGRRPSEVQRLEYYSVFKHWSVANLEKTWSAIKEVSDRFPPISFFKQVSHDIRQEELRLARKKNEGEKAFVPAEDQLERNRRGYLLSNFVLYWTKKNGLAASSNVDGVHTLYDANPEYYLRKVKENYKSGDWDFFKRTLPTNYPFLAKIMKQAVKEAKSAEPPQAGHTGGSRPQSGKT